MIDDTEEFISQFQRLLNAEAMIFKRQQRTFDNYVKQLKASEDVDYAASTLAEYLFGALGVLSERATSIKISAMMTGDFFYDDEVKEIEDAIGLDDDEELLLSADQIDKDIDAEYAAYMPEVIRRSTRVRKLMAG